MNRRTFVQTAALAAGGASIAGGVARGQEGEMPEYELPAYSGWVPIERLNPDHNVTFSHFDWEALDTLGESDSDDEDEEEDDEELGDTMAQFLDVAPIVGLPFTGGFTHLLASFGFAFYPFADVILPAGGPPVVGIRTQSMTSLGDCVVFHGEYDTDVFAEHYAEDDGFTAVDERGEFTVYVGTEGIMEGSAYAVSEGTVIAGLGMGESSVTTAIDLAQGDEDRLVDTEDGQWLFETTGDSQVVFGVWDVDSVLEVIESNAADDPETEGVISQRSAIAEQNPVLTSVNSLVSTLSFNSEDGESGDPALGSIEAQFSGIFPEDDVPTEEELEEHMLGDSAGEVQTIAVEGNRAHISAIADPIEDEEVDAAFARMLR